MPMKVTVQDQPVLCSGPVNVSQVSSRPGLQKVSATPCGVSHSTLCSTTRGLVCGSGFPSEYRRGPTSIRRDQSAGSGAYQYSPVTLTRNPNPTLGAAARNPGGPEGRSESTALPSEFQNAVDSDLTSGPPGF